MGLAPLGTLMPWRPWCRAANTTTSLAPRVDRGTGDHARWGLEASRLQGSRHDRPGLVGWVPRFQGHPFTSGPIGHGYPDILVDEPPWYQPGGGAMTGEGPWDQVACCASVPGDQDLRWPLMPRPSVDPFAPIAMGKQVR